MRIEILRPNFEKRDGLAVVVVQDAVSREVLMVCYTDEAGWRKTLETGIGSYYSTSRKKAWTKGEESGNFQKVVGIRVDCDGDALVYLVEPQGNRVACHTNARSCFYRSVTGRPTDDHAPQATDKEKLLYVQIDVHSNFWK
ncbi:MAG: phosphoribosyl-AMP cyclohydrolase [bacterium]|nr:phosphoribosyl-AMP cyclohydrolase [bacterium]